MHHRYLLAAAFVVAAATAALPAQQTTTIDLESVVALATANDASLVDLERRVEDAAEALGWGPYRDDLSLSLSGSLGGDALSALTAGGTATLGASVDVLPQLMLSGQLAGEVASTEGAPADPFTGSLGMTLKPLADAQRDERDTIAYERAKLALEAGVRSVAFTAVTRLVDAVAARQGLAIAEADVELAERKLASLEALAERDRATREEVEAARDALRAARQARGRDALAAERARWSLAEAVGLTPEAIALPGWDELDLAASVVGIRRAADGLSADALADASQTVRSAALDVESARVELAAARRFTPELTAGAETRFPLEPNAPKQQPRYSLSLDFTVRPSDWDGSARAEAEEDLVFAERALEVARSNVGYDARSALLELEFAVEDLDAALHDLELAGQRLAEAAFRFERGDVTRLTLDTAELEVTKAHATVDLARAEVVRRWYAIDLEQF